MLPSWGESVLRPRRHLDVNAEESSENYSLVTLKIIKILSALILPFVRFSHRKSMATSVTHSGLLLTLSPSQWTSEPSRLPLTETEENIFDIIIATLNDKSRSTVARVAGGWVRDKV